MLRKKQSLFFLLALIVAVLVSACGSAPAPKPADTDAIEVATVDEFLAALKPGAKLRLTADSYDLTTASSYGGEGTEYYRWLEVPDGYELNIHGIENLTLTGNGIGATTLCTLPRYAPVLSFTNCSNVSLEGITIGHVDGAGGCSGSVIHCEMVSQLSVTACDLYGCGTIAVEALDSSDITVSLSLLRDCSYGAVYLYRCSSVLVSECQISGIGSESDNGTSVFYASSGNGFAVINSTISGNTAYNALSIFNTPNVYFGGNAFEDNRIVSAFFDLDGYSPVIESCAFLNNNSARWFSSNTIILPVSKDGTSIQRGSEFLAMQCENVSFSGFPNAAPSYDAASLPAGDAEITEVHVSTAEEFVAAIDSNRTIIIDSPELTITDAYGKSSNTGGANYYWESCFDGYGLIIHDVVNLTIRGAGEEATTLLAVPRYADVLTFVNCRAVSVEELTAGHTIGSECAGGVLQFRGCMQINVRDCDLFGCGIVGINSDNCTGLTVSATRIHDCSYGAIWLNTTEGAVIESCTITRCGTPHIVVDSYSFGCSYNGTELESDCSVVIRPNGTLAISSAYGSNYPSICYNGITMYDLTLRVGERLLLTCSDEINGNLTDVTWDMVGDGLELTPNEDGSCFIEAVSTGTYAELYAFVGENAALCVVTILQN